MTGAAVPKARFVIESGKKRNSASVDRSGAFALMLPLPTPERLRAAPCSVRVFASTKGMRLVLPNGDPALSVRLQIDRADSADRVVARSNDERVAAMAALAVASRRPLAEVEGLRMMGLAGERLGDPPSVAMPHVAQVAVVPLPAPVAVAPAKTAAPKTKAPSKSSAQEKSTTEKTAATKPPATPSSKSSKSTTAAKPPAKSSSSKNAGSAVVTVTPPADSHAAAPPPAAPAPAEPSKSDPPKSDCGCRIKGTVELVSNPPPTEPVGVVIWVDGAPQIRDSVELALGSPRPFELLDVPCGTTQLRVQVSAERSYLLQSPGVIENLSCTNGRLIQPRIVLVPRKGY
jgi:hypothetical protein